MPSPVDTAALKKRCFVISPIGDEGSPTRRHADMVLNSIIKSALSGFDVKRADDFGTPDMITDKIIEAILNYELVVADLTGHNPNVFYEIGIRHMISKPIIPIKGDSDTRLPFDLGAINTIFYDIADWHSHVTTRQSIQKAAEIVMQNDYKVTNPVTHAISYTNMSHSADPKDAVIAELMNKFAMLENAMNSGFDAIERRQKSIGIGFPNDQGTGILGVGVKPNALLELSQDAHHAPGTPWNYLSGLGVSGYSAGSAPTFNALNIPPKGKS